MRIIKLCSYLFLVLNFFLAPFANAMDKEKLKAFFQEYDGSSEKKNWNWERLPYAIEKGHHDIAEFLILSGDPLNHYTEHWPSPVWKENGHHDMYFKHPILTAMKQGDVSLVVLMTKEIKEFSKVEEYKNILSKTPNPGQYKYEILERKGVMFIAINECPKSYDIVNALLTLGVDVNMQIDGYRTFPEPSGFYTHTKPLTLLKAALALKKIDIVQLLLDNNADFEYCGNYYITPLCMAVDDNYIEGVRLLLSYGADPLKRPPGGALITPLELAMQKEYWDIVDLLLDAAVK